MSKLLYIKASVDLGQEPHSYVIAESFIEEYKTSHPQTEVKTIELINEDINFLDSSSLQVMFGPKDENSKTLDELKYAYEFLDANVIVIATPLWNLGVPAMLKAYLDRVSVSGITFKYTEQGPVGLCQGKKAFIVSSRGGIYQDDFMKSLEHETSYLRSLFTFFGFDKIESIAAEGTDIIGADTKAIVEAKSLEAKEIGKIF